MTAAALRATVCELPEAGRGLDRAWEDLCAHVGEAKSHLVLLPEMPFHPWLPATREVSAEAWSRAMDAHDRWMGRLPELGSPLVAGTRPVIRGGEPRNEAFLWTREEGYSGIHHKAYLPEEEGFWEASWYRRGNPDPESGDDGRFLPFRTSVAGVGEVILGFQVCTEIWFGQVSRRYAGEGVHVVLAPRATYGNTVDKWLAGGRTLAVVAGAYCLSSNFAGEAGAGRWAGAGWVFEPEEGELIGRTDERHPFLTVEVDLARADRAKNTYPRYVEG